MPPIFTDIQSQGVDMEYPNTNVRPIRATPIGELPINLGQRNDAVTALKSTHDIYDAKIKKWQCYYDWYDGENIAKYIYKHPRESQENYRERLKRAYYYNYTASIVNLIASFIYSKTVARSFFRQSQDLAQQEHIEKNAFWQNVDLKNSPIDKFMTKVFILSQIFGYVDVVCDMPRTEEELRNEQEREDKGIRPYLFYICPTDMLNWETDNLGNFLWMRWREKADKQTDPFGVRDKRSSTYNYRTWTRDAWYVHQIIETPGMAAQVRLLDAGEHTLGMVPVVRFYGQKDILDEQQGKSFVADIGKINVAIANYVSLIEEEIYNHCVTGDTLIDCPRDLTKYPDGVPIKCLVGKNFDTYSWSREQGRFVINRASNVRLTRKKAEVWKLIYKWKNLYGNWWEYGTLRATPDHKILLNDNKYRQLQYLRAGDRLVPLTRHVNEPFNGYAYLYPDNTIKSKIREHRFVVSHYEDLEEENHAHHIDGNSGKKHSPEAIQKIRDARTGQLERMNHEVVSVEFDGYEDVYCMNVEKTHNFVANGIVIHNCFNILVMEDPNQTMGDPTADNAQAGVTIGTNNALYWGGAHPPFFLSPSSNPIEVILNVIEKNVEEIYKISTLWTDTGIRESRSGVSYCLAKGTLIDCPRDLTQYPNGIPIEDLVGKGAFYVYSRLNGVPALSLATKAWQSGTQVKVYRVSFEWYAYGHWYQGSIVATAEHKFMLRNGKYKKVRHLQTGDALMPFTRSMKSKNYAGIAGPGMATYEYEHRFIVRNIYDTPIGSNVAVHHINGNKFDNRIENLEIMSRSEHATHHMEDEDFKARVSAGGAKRRGIENGRWLIFNKKLILRALHENNWQVTKAAAALDICFVTLKRKMAIYGITIPNNHKVTAVEFAGYEDVYDIEVPDAHNFVANGIVVHNSYEFNRTNSMLAETAELMQEGETKIHQIYSAWLQEPWEGYIDYPDSYDVEVLEQELQTTVDAKKAVRSPTFKRELEKRIARKVLSNSTTDVIETIMNEIDTMEEQTLTQHQVDIVDSDTETSSQDNTQ